MALNNYRLPDGKSGYVRFIRGTPAAWTALTNKDDNTLYFICEKDATSGYLYLGEKLISGGGNSSGVDATILGRISALEKKEDTDTNKIAEMQDVSLSSKITDGSSLVYDASSKKWTNKVVTASGTTTGVNALEDLSDVTLTLDISDGSVLTYDSSSGKWKNSTISTPDVMVGASDSSNGQSGLVPAPKFYEANRYLRGDGTWVDLDSNLAAEIFKLRKGDDGSVRDIAADEILTIVGSNVPEAYNTIEKIANWIVTNGTSIDSSDGASRLNALEQAVYGADKTSSTTGLVAVSKKLVTTIYGDTLENVEGLTSVCSRIDIDNAKMKNDISVLQQNYDTLNTTVVDLDGRLTWKKY